MPRSERLPLSSGVSRLYKLQCEDQIFYYNLDTLLKYPDSPLTHKMLRNGTRRITYLDFNADAMRHIARFQKHASATDFGALPKSMQRLCLDYSRRLRLPDVEAALTRAAREEIRSVQMFLECAESVLQCFKVMYPAYGAIVDAVLGQLSRMSNDILRKMRHALSTAYSTLYRGESRSRSRTRSRSPSSRRRGSRTRSSESTRSRSLSVSRSRTESTGALEDRGRNRRGRSRSSSTSRSGRSESEPQGGGGGQEQEGDDTRSREYDEPMGTETVRTRRDEPARDGDARGTMRCSECGGEADATEHSDSSLPELVSATSASTDAARQETKRAGRRGGGGSDFASLRMLMSVVDTMTSNRSGRGGMAQTLRSIRARASPAESKRLPEMHTAVSDEKKTDAIATTAGAGVSAAASSLPVPSVPSVLSTAEFKAESESKRSKFESKRQD